MPSVPPNLGMSYLKTSKSFFRERTLKRLKTSFIRPVLMKFLMKEARHLSKHLLKSFLSQQATL